MDFPVLQVPTVFSGTESLSFNIQWCGQSQYTKRGGDDGRLREFFDTPYIKSLRCLPGAALVVTALVVPAMIVTWLAFARSHAVVPAFVVTAPAVAAMIITGLALPRSGGVFSTLVITASVMPAVVVSRLTLTCNCASRPVVASVSLLAVTATIVATIDARAGLRTVGAVRSTIFDSAPADGTIDTVCARNRAAADALMDGPVMHASAAPAHAYAGRTPTARLAGAVGE